MKNKKFSPLKFLDPDYLVEKVEKMSEKVDNLSQKMDDYNSSLNPYKHWRRDRRIAKREENKKNKK